MTENIYSVTDNKNVFRLGTKNNQIIIYQRLPSPDTTFLWAGHVPSTKLGCFRHQNVFVMHATE